MVVPLAQEMTRPGLGLSEEDAAVLRFLLAEDQAWVVFGFRFTFGRPSGTAGNRVTAGRVRASQASGWWA